MPDTMHSPFAPIIPAEMLLLAYRGGVFPMADGRDESEVFWVEPRERAIFPLDNFIPSRSLAKIVRQGRYRVTCDTAFGEVVACAAPRPDHPDTWISQRIEQSYIALHEAGHAHSIECWRDSEHGPELVGGLYGVSFDRTFCGESMFSRADNASKVALVWLVALMRRAGFILLDCQFMTDHLASLGAVSLSREDYRALLSQSARGQGARPLDRVWHELEAEARTSANQSSAGQSSPGKLILQSLTQTS